MLCLGVPKLHDWISWMLNIQLIRRPNSSSPTSLSCYQANLPWSTLMTHFLLIGAFRQQRGVALKVQTTRSEADPCMPVRAEETGLSMLTMLSEAGTGSEERASDYSLWFTASFALSSLPLPRSPYCLSPTSPLYFSFCILSFSLPHSASR